MSAPLLALLRSALVIAVFALASTGAHGYARFCASADVLQFGNRAVGSATTRTVRIQSCGDEPWTFTSVALHAATSAAFRVDSACTTGMTLAPGEGCDVDVTFAPVAAGQVSGALWLRQTSTTADQLVTFYGRGVVDSVAGTAAIAFSPPSLSFGNVDVGTTSAWRSVELRNVGTATLVPSALVVNGPQAWDFRTISHGDANDCAVGRAVAPGAACTLHFTFTPTRAGAHAAQLVVDAPQLASLVTLPIEANGIDVRDGSIEAIEFFNPARNHYFVTTEAAEAAMIDAGGVGSGWQRTGERFRVWPVDGAAPAHAVDVCRFFGTPGVGPGAHFFTGDARECETVRRSSAWTYEGLAFRAALPDGATCAPAFDPVVRLFWSGREPADMRHRYVVDSRVVVQMALAGWIVEGPVFCSPR